MLTRLCSLSHFISVSCKQRSHLSARLIKAEDNHTDYIWTQTHTLTHPYMSSCHNEANSWEINYSQTQLYAQRLESIHKLKKQVHASKIRMKNVTYICLPMEVYKPRCAKAVCIRNNIGPHWLSLYEQKHICQNIFSIPQNNEIDIYITEIYLIVHVWNNMRVKILTIFIFGWCLGSQRHEEM